jgi:hypothetical protein
MSLKKILRNTLLASVLTVTACSPLAYQGRIGDTEVTLYKARSNFARDKMVLKVGDTTWTYTDQSTPDGNIDYAEKQKGETKFKYNGRDEFGKAILAGATKNYQIFLKKIEEMIKEEIDYNYPFVK